MKLDHIYVLTLHEFPNRKEKFIKNNPELSSQDNFSFFVEKKEKNPLESIFNSHFKILKDAKEKGYKYILVFEDDAYSEYTFSEINDFILSLNESDEYKMPDDWQYLLLGYIPVTSEYYTKKIFKVNCAYDLHSYIVNVDNCELYTFPGNGVQIDDFLLCLGKNHKDVFFDTSTKTNFKVYASYKNFYLQETNEGQVSMDQSHYFRFYKLLGPYLINVSCYINTLTLCVLSLLCFFIIFILIIYFIFKKINPSEKS